MCSSKFASLTTARLWALNVLHRVGMSAGLPKYVVVNLKTLSEKFTEGEEVSLDTLSQKRMLNLSGREAKLPLKVCLLQLCMHTPKTACGSTFRHYRKEFREALHLCKANYRQVVPMALQTSCICHWPNSCSLVQAVPACCML